MKIHLRNPYWGAWKEFGWQKGDYGIGISESKLNQALASKERLEITIGASDKVYSIDPVYFIKKALSLNAKYTAKDDTKLLLIPISYLETFKL